MDCRHLPITNIDERMHLVEAAWSVVQSAAKMFEHLRYYLQLFSDLIAVSYYLMLVISNVNPKDHVLTNIYFIKLLYA